MADKLPLLLRLLKERKKKKKKANGKKSFPLAESAEKAAKFIKENP